MIALLQRTDGIKCIVDNQVLSEYKGKCLLILLGVRNDDDDTDLEYILRKIPELRIFEDDNSKMNLSAKEVGAGLFVISQFTLFAKCKKGRRPNFMDAAESKKGEYYYNKCIEEFKKTGLEVRGGSFGAHMNLLFNNDGPVTIILDSRE